MQVVSRGASPERHCTTPAYIWRKQYEPCAVSLPALPSVLTLLTSPVPRPGTMTRSQGTCCLRRRGRTACSDTRSAALTGLTKHGVHRSGEGAQSESQVVVQRAAWRELFMCVGRWPDVCVGDLAIQMS